MEDSDTEIVVTGGPHVGSLEPWLSLGVFAVAIIAIVLLTRWKGIDAGRIGLIVGAIVFPLVKITPLLIADVNLTIKFGAPILTLLPDLAPTILIVAVTWLIFSLPAFWFGKKLYMRRTADTKSVSAF